MNTEDFVTYSQAVALKKLGFNYDCDYCYSEDKELYKYDYYTEYYTGVNIDISAPTLSQTQKWFRKEKGLYLMYGMGQDRKNNSKFSWYVTDNHGYIVSDLASEVVFNSPEEALSAGITKCIEFLEKIKEL